MNALAKPYQPFTSAEFHKMARRGAFDDIRVELRRGMLVKMSPKHIPHALVQEDLIFALKLAIKAADLPWRVATQTSAALGEGFNPMPDIVVFDLSLVPDPQGPIAAGAVKLIVEVADSSLEDDMGEKRDDYALAGLAEYWVADVDDKVVHMHAAPVNGAFTKVTQAKLGEALAMLTQPQIMAQIS
jgi:Uma2 family endonuclease